MELVPLACEDGIPSVLNSLNPDELIWVQTVCKDNQQNTSSQRVNIKAMLMLYGLKTENTLNSLYSCTVLSISVFSVY